MHPLSSVIPPELTSSLLTALGLLGTWFGVWLARRGKKEDTKLATAQNTFNELKFLAEARLAEIDRLTRALVAAASDNDRLREVWEKRWDRQMERCRAITAPLVSALAVCQAGREADPEVERALHALEVHNDTDHDSDTSY